MNNSSVTTYVFQFLSELKLCRNTELLCKKLEQQLFTYTPCKKCCASDQLRFSSSSPFLTSLVQLAESESKKESSYVERQAQVLVNLPHNVANVLFNASCTQNFFDPVLYFDHLCDNILAFVLDTPDASVDCSAGYSPSISLADCNKVSRVVIQAVINNGQGKQFLKRLHNYFLDDSARSLYSCKQLVGVLCAFFASSVKPRFSHSKRTSKTVSNKIILDFFVTIFQFTEQGDSDFVGRVMINFFLEEGWNGDSEVFLHFKNIFYSCILSEILSSTCLSRRCLKWIFDHFLLGQDIPEEHLEDLFLSVTTKWGDTQVLEHTEVSRDISLMNSVIHVIIFMKKTARKIKTECLSNILEGVSLRLGSTRHTTLRENGMTVAAAYAHFSVEGDASEALLSNDTFKDLLQKWLSVGYSSNESVLTTARNTGNTCQSCELNLSEEQFPFNPDGPFFFFGRKTASTSIVVGDQERDSFSRATTAQLLPSFGMIFRNDDYFEKGVVQLSSIKECYRALVGIGRDANAQLNEVQRDFECGLRGFSSIFRSAEGDEKIRSEIEVELAPLAPLLLRVLCDLSIIAPEEKTKELTAIRYTTFVEIIAFCPSTALQSASNLLYSGSLGIIQRVDVARALGDAAVLLSNRKVTKNLSSNPTAAKLVYPPIPNESSLKLSKPIDLTKSRRWGYSAHANCRPTTLNSLGEVAANFIAALLARHGNDHFKFFQDNDPHTPSEVLSTMVKIFQSITNVRHIATTLSSGALQFVLCVLSNHPDGSVRRIAWIAFEEVMRSWCGAPPYTLIIGNRFIPNKVESFSVVVSGEWIQMLVAARTLCQKLLESNDVLTMTAIRVVSRLRDLSSSDENG